jgi:hypothetical protein
VNDRPGHITRMTHIDAGRYRTFAKPSAAKQMTITQVTSNSTPVSEETFLTLDEGQALVQGLHQAKARIGRAAMQSQDRFALAARSEGNPRGDLRSSWACSFSSLQGGNLAESSCIHLHTWRLVVAAIEQIRDLDAQ